VTEFIHVWNSTSSEPVHVGDVAPCNHEIEWGENMETGEAEKVCWHCGDVFPDACMHERRHFEEAHTYSGLQVNQLICSDCGENLTHTVLADGSW
jgi:hypothetical protein